VKPGRGDERDEAAEQRERVEVDSDRAVTERLLQRDARYGRALPATSPSTI
jgi:hypothetical protein